MPEPGFAAFISYRHVEPDRTWAKWLHSALETWRTPAALTESGVRSRVGRVFRDEEELAASWKLSESIETALRDSDCLIVVCSPRTPESKWVEQEVVRFIALGRAERVFTLLVEGEPDVSFPVALRANEPLAADVRAHAGESSRQLRENAKLRLIAGILGCNFDDLRQRESERQRRRLMVWAATASTLVLLFLALAVYAFVQRGRAIDEARVARAQTLAAQAQLALATTPVSEELGTTGPERAILLAVEALRLAPVLEADAALRNGLAKLPTAARPLWFTVPEDGFEGDAPQVPASVSSPDGQYVARSPQNPEEPLVMEHAASKRTWQLPHEWLLQAIRFSPDSRWLCTVTGRVSMDASDPSATVLYGSTIRIWEIAGMRLRTQVSLADQAGIARAFFSPDGKTLATVGDKNAVKLWTLWPDRLEAEACSRLTRNLSPTEWRRYMGDAPIRATCPGLPVVSE